MEAYNEEEIKQILGDAAIVKKDYNVEAVVCRLLLAWATAKAEAERYLFWLRQHEIVGDDERRYWTDADWLQSVLSRISWPQGEKKDET